MSARRVAVTGIGVVSRLRRYVRRILDRRGRWDAARIRPMTLVPPGTLRFPNARGGRPDSIRCAHFEEKDAGFLDRFAQFAVVAAREAIRAAGLKIDAALGRRCAIVTGSCGGGQTTEDENFRSLYALKRDGFRPLTIPMVMANAGASRISMEFGITGPVYTISTACSSSNHAIGQAFWMVRNGVADVAITGGSEAPFARDS